MPVSSLRMPSARHSLPALLAWCPLLLALGTGYCALHAWIGVAAPAPWSQTLAWSAASLGGWWLASPWLLAALRERHATAARRARAQVELIVAIMLAITVEWLLRRMLGDFGLAPLPWLTIAFRVLPVALLLALIRLALDADRGAAPRAGQATLPASPVAVRTQAGVVAGSVPDPRDPRDPPSPLTAWRGSVRVEVPLDAIRWISAEENYVALHCADGSAPLLRSTLAAMSQRLAPEGFIRVHRRLLVRHCRIRGCLGPARLQLDDGTVLPIGRSYRDAVRIGPAPASVGADGRRHRDAPTQQHDAPREVHGTRP